jgi:hypothetical protein
MGRKPGSVSLFLFIFISTLAAGVHPNSFINQSEINAIKAKVNTGVAPWKSAYSRMISAANSALSQTPKSVTTNGAGCNGNINLYSSDGGYSTDGVYNPQAERGDYKNGMQIGNALVDLGLGYAFTKDKKYADKAITLFKVWCLDAATRMIPSGKNHGPHTCGMTSGDVEIFFTFAQFFYAADLIWNYPGWNVTDKEGLKAWVRSMVVLRKGLMYYKGEPMVNNWEDWRLLYLATGSVVIEDTELLTYAFNRWKETKDPAIAPDGHLPIETGRTRSMTYSLFSLDAMCQTAEIARHHGVNLYDYTVNGKNLKLVFDFHAQYLKYGSNLGFWPYEMISPHTSNQDVAVYELAYSYWKDPDYLAVINAWGGRPMTNIWVMDHSTLTHGNRFELNVTLVKGIPELPYTQDNHIVFNNPVVSGVVFDLDGIGFNGPFSIWIHDNTGNVIYHQVRAYRNTPLRWNGTTIAGIPVRPGVYYYNINGGVRSYNGRIVKIK